MPTRERAREPWGLNSGQPSIGKPLLLPYLSSEHRESSHGQNLLTHLDLSSLREIELTVRTEFIRLSSGFLKSALY